MSDHPAPANPTGRELDELERLAKAAYAEYWGLSEPDTTREWAMLPCDERVRFRDVVSVIVGHYEPGGRNYQLVTAERDALRRAVEGLRVVIEWWKWGAHLKAPFTPNGVGNNDGVVRDADGREVADCGGWETRADIIGALLNFAAALATPGAGTGDGGATPNGEAR